MSNMSYCMYENTLNDLRQVYRDMRERAESEPEEVEPLSRDEEAARMALIDLCQEIVNLNMGDDDDYGYKE